MSLRKKLLNLYKEYENDSTKDYSPKDAKLLNRTLYFLMKSYFYKTENENIYLKENEDISIVRRNLNSNYEKEYIYNCLKDSYQDYILFDENLYENSEYMTDEEFENYEKELENKKIYKKNEVYNNLKIILNNKKELLDCKEVLNLLDETIKSKKFNFLFNKINNKYSYLIKKVINPYESGIGDNKMSFFLDMLEADGEELLLRKAINNSNSEYSYLLHPNIFDDSKYAIEKSIKKWGLENKFYKKEDLIKEIIEKDNLAKDLYENKKINESVLVKNLYESLLVKVLKYIKKELETNINYNYTMDDVKKDNDVVSFLDFIKKDEKIKMLLENNELKMNVYLTRGHTIKIEKIKLNEVIEYLDDKRLFDLNIDEGGQHFKGVGMGIASPYQDTYYRNEKNDEEYIFVAYSEYRILGAALLKNGANFDGELDEEDMVLSGIAVDENYRGRNISEKIYKEVVEYCEKENKNLIRTNPTRDGIDYINKKFTKIANNSTALIINSENRNIYSLLKKELKDKQKVKNCFKELVEFHNFKSEFLNKDDIEVIGNVIKKYKNNKNNFKLK